VLILVEERSSMLLALDEALTQLATLNERLTRVVEYRFFGDMGEEETAGALGVTAAPCGATGSKRGCGSTTGYVRRMNEHRLKAAYPTHPRPRLASPRAPFSCCSASDRLSCVRRQRPLSMHRSAVPRAPAIPTAASLDGWRIRAGHILSRRLMTDPRSAERWQQVEQLLDAALDTPPEERPALLETACAGDTALRAEVERLLLACVESDGFLREPAEAFAAPILASLAGDPDPAGPAAPGTRIGPYRILEEAGRGGMAVVYRAERDDGEFRQRVALKLVRAGVIPEDELLRRFRDERQILADLEHPGIARLLDGGVTEAGLPWFALEYVEGTPIDRYCDERRLDIEARLSLFCAVCEAVQHAHRRRIVHRDLKPGNILVIEPDGEEGEAGRVKLLDFGIAKLLATPRAEELAERTRPGMRLMTPEYASPEQLRCETVTPAADVYALGVLLYRLLCGRHPYRLTGRSVEGIEQRVLDTQPEPPSAAVFRATEAGVEEPGALASEAVAAARSVNPEQLRRRLRGDLDAIVLKALSKEPEQRYSNAGELAVAVRRHSRGLWVGARREAHMRGARAFLRRGGVMAALAAIAAVVVIFGNLLSSRPAGPVLDASRVVVAPFENRTGQAVLDPVGSMAADWIIQGLVRAELSEVVPMTAAMISQRYVSALPDLGDSAARLRELARETGAGTVVSGSYYRQGDTLHFDARITDAVAGRVLHAIETVAAPVDAPLEGIDRLRTRVLAALAPLGDTRETHARALVSPPTYEAYASYIAGIEAYIRRDLPATLLHYERSAAVDSAYPMPRIASAIAWLNLGDWATADSIVQSLEHARDRLGPFETATLDMVQGWLRGDDAAAYDAVVWQARLAPGSIGHYQVADQARRLNRPREALRVLAEIGPERGELRGWYPYWRELTYAHHMLGDHRRELREARRAREIYPDQPNMLLYEVRALAALGRMRDLDRRLEERLTSPSTEAPSPGIVMSIAARELHAHGHLEEAAALHRRVLAWYAGGLAEEQRTSGRRRALAWYERGPAEGQQTSVDRRALASALHDAERWPEAEALYRQLADEQPENINLQGRLGTLAARRGERGEAERISRWLQEARQPYLLGVNTLWRARIAALLGDREAAVGLLREAFAQGQRYGPFYHNDPDLEPLRDYPPFRELLRPKG
jgi:serine/threonine protein kinase/tetratricopeptide (TPR) repeat protein